MDNIADYLEALTQTYWIIATARAGRGCGKLTVENAIQTVNHLEASLGPQRALLQSVKRLGHLIIEGKAPKAKKNKAIEPSTNILQMIRGNNA